MTNDDEIAKALERWRRWEALPDGCPLQDRYAIYPAGGNLTQMNMAHQRDLRVLAAAYAARTPVVPGPVREAAERQQHWGENHTGRFEKCDCTGCTMARFILSLAPGGPTP